MKDLELNIFTKEKLVLKDIENLISADAEENLYLEFKRANALSLGKEKEKSKQELAKDVSAMANSDGGVIIYGVKEENRVITGFDFIDGTVIKEEFLTQVISDGIQMRIEGIQIFAIQKDKKLEQTIYVIRIPRSRRAPHFAVKLQKYFKRNNSVAEVMQEYEVREKYLLKENVQLIIDKINLTYSDPEKDGITYTFNVEFWVKNVGQTTAKDYKIRFEIDGLYGNADSVNWDEKVFHIDQEYSGLEGTEIFYNRFSSIGNKPIFSGETILAALVKVTCGIDKVKKLIPELQVLSILFFDGGRDSKVTKFSRAKEHFLTLFD